MAITVTPKYKPFTYEELVKPLEGYWEKYDKAEKDLGDFSTKLAALDYIVQSEPEDSPLRAKYSDYKSKLETAADVLSHKGLDQEARNLLKEVTSSFDEDISPIATQYARRQKLEDEQRKVKESKPSIYFSKRAAETSLAEMVDNPNWSYTSFVGDDITKAVQSMVSPVATILDKIFKDGDIEGYSILKSQYGITPDDVVQYYNGENGALKKYFDKAKETVVKSYGVDTWNDQNALDTAYQYANMGIPKAIGKLTPQLVINRKPTDDGESGDGKNPPEIPSKSSVSIHSMGTIQDNDRLTNTLKAEKQWKSIAGTDGTNGTGVTIKANEYRGALAKEGITDFSVKYLEYLAKGGDNKSEIMELSDGSFVYTKIDRKGERVQKLARRLLDEYYKGNQMRASVIHTTTNADGTPVELGLYGPTITSSMDAKLAYDKSRSSHDYTVYEPSFESNTKKYILTKWTREASYEEVPMYKINNTGKREELKDKDKSTILTNIMTSNGNIKDTVGLFLSPQNGIEIEYNGSRYVIDNYSSRDLSIYSGLMKDTYNELYDFEEQTLRDYLDEQGSYKTLGTDDFTKEGKLSKAGLEFLNQEETWEAKAESNYKHAFVYVGDELVKIIADKSTGGILGIIPISSITGNYRNSGPGLIMENLASQIAKGWHPRTINKDLTTPPRGK